MNSKLIALLANKSFLVDNSLDLFVAHAVGLSLDFFSEVKVVNDVLLCFHLSLDVGHLFLGGIVLSSQRLLGLHGHAHLAELEEHLEVDEERKHFSCACCIADLSKQFSLDAFGAHVDRLGLFANPLLLEGGWVATLDGSLEGFDGGENVNAFLVEGSVGVAGDELANDVKNDFACIAGSGLGVHDLLDVVNGGLVAQFGELGSSFVHRGQKLVHAIELS
jgi:hypothetical protein